jgi:hypothetical protein
MMPSSKYCSDTKTQREAAETEELVVDNPYVKEN